MSDRPLEKRGALLVERNFQLRFILSFTAILLAGTLVSGVLLYLILSRHMGHSEIGNRGLLIGICIANGVSLVLLLYPTTRVTLKTSHKIGGPIRRFQGIASSIRDGNLEVSTTLREGDQLGPMAASLGEMVSAMKERITAMQKQSEMLTATIDTTLRKAEQDVYLRSNIHAELLEIKLKNDEIVKELVKYRL